MGLRRIPFLVKWNIQIFQLENWSSQIHTNCIKISFTCNRLNTSGNYRDMSIESTTLKLHRIYPVKIKRSIAQPAHFRRHVQDSFWLHLPKFWYDNHSFKAVRLIKGVPLDWETIQVATMNGVMIACLTFAGKWFWVCHQFKEER